MAHSPSHRQTLSTAGPILQPPQTPRQHRSMSSPASNTSLNLPQDTRKQPARPPSPLRNTFIPDTSTGINPADIDSDDDLDDDNNSVHNQRRWKGRSPSPASSVSNLAASFKERVGTLLGSMSISGSTSGSMPSDAELEAEAERARDQSRREAERILTREAEERRRVEERVLVMMEQTRGLPPPPSPSNSQRGKESPTGWWTAAKNKLTPTKEKELTPAQQVIQDTKAKEKEAKKDKGKGKERDVSPSPRPALVPPPHRKPVPPSPSSPTPSRPSLSNMPPVLTPSPMRSGSPSSPAPSREAPPLYAQFNSQGTLDIPTTLLTIARRFEKLEKWTVGHVRALEERMSDVERWLVDKEGQLQQVSDSNAKSTSNSNSTEALKEMKDGLTELQGRVAELGREVARIATSPSNLSSGPAAQYPGPIGVAPNMASSIVSHEDSAMVIAPRTPSLHSRFSTTARESTSPPMGSSNRGSTGGTRLPYPAGDYAEIEGIVSPPGSPPAERAGLRTRLSSMSLTNGTWNGSVSNGKGVTGIATPPASRTLPAPPATSAALTTPPPPATNNANTRMGSVSPTPRKRYTVALGEPIVSPPDLDYEEPFGNGAESVTWDSGAGDHGSRHGEDDEREKRGTEKRDKVKNRDGDDDEDVFEDETIGKKTSLKYKLSVPIATAREEGGETKKGGERRRMRTQSAYGFATIGGMRVPIDPETGSGRAHYTQPVTPLRTKAKSRSTERLTTHGSGSGNGYGGSDNYGGAAVFNSASVGGASGGKFVDPLVLRRQEREKEREREGRGALVIPKPVLGKKVPVGQLVAFFDEKKG